ncbi:MULTISPECIES: 1-hydroxycarotenoid 3,4-desaturase CrtD [unclassified Iodidimonas]|jgi:1-hydroxycarotenoid 3,4-desaturase|uniref:1-hydroxycarotenoid 3,4-desaturase CrtD n=1 Tax=unclassified Iodidimonas TaxID=2626145 RepID=UPI002482C515|nr:MULTISPECIES: 1-hydroxycarotenoid 3,4-desaturase CrtD [unclassified Iodidimonas]
MAASVIIIGAGIGGLSAALVLASRGYAVTILERQPVPGGKIRSLDGGGRPIDSGPTVFTLRAVFDEIFAHAGLSLDDHLGLKPASVLARHFWSGGARLDLHADPERTCAAIGDFAGAADARAYQAFAAQSKRCFETLDHSFMRQPKPSLSGLIGAGLQGGAKGMTDLLAISPFARYGESLARQFRDPRLQQLFGRYATYCGSSPYAAPATLMLVAHAEQKGVWQIKGGMAALARVLGELAIKAGALFCPRHEVTAIRPRGPKSKGGGGYEILINHQGSQQSMMADMILFNGDKTALQSGYFGNEMKKALPKLSQAKARAERSLSALTWSMLGRIKGGPLHHHMVCFSDDYGREFDQLFRQKAVPHDPTVYLCAQDRSLSDDQPTGRGPVNGTERLFCLINAPANGDQKTYDEEEIKGCEERMRRRLEACGLELSNPHWVETTSPQDFAALYPATGGALYGPVSHGWRASFQRPGVKTACPGLYLAGGSVHPGPGVPMAALSGLMAAKALIRDHEGRDLTSP